MICACSVLLFFLTTVTECRVFKSVKPFNPVDSSAAIRKILGH